MDDLGYGQFGPNSDMFTGADINPITLKRAEGMKPEQAIEFAKSASPNLTRLANEGTRFTDGYVACPLCAPSRTALMTSRYPQRFGIYVNDDINKAGVPRDQYFLAKSLQQGGYSTGVIGKWHLAVLKGGMERGTGQHPLDRGFDYFFGFNAPGTSYYDSDILMRNRESAKAEGYTTDQFTDEAIGFIRRSKDKPFFLYLPYNAVHGPLGAPAPERYQKRYHTGDKQVDHFFAYLSAADEGVGRIRRTLGELGQEENTLIFVLSDNGAPGGSPLPSNGPFLGFKGQVWQGGVRIAMLMWGPGVPSGKISHEPVISMDIMPTALAAAGAGLPSGHTVDGRNIMPLIKGEAKPPLHPTLFWAGQLSSRWAGSKNEPRFEPPAWATRKGRWMLRYWSHLNRHELYDLDSDRGERHDVIAQHADVAADLKAAYAGWFKGVAKPLGWAESDWRKLAPVS